MLGFIESKGREHITQKRDILNIHLENIILKSSMPEIELTLDRYSENKKYFISFDIHNIGQGVIVDKKGEEYNFEKMEDAEKLFNLVKREILKGKKGNYSIQATLKGFSLYVVES
jgi:hypothetical protein